LTDVLRIVFSIARPNIRVSRRVYCRHFFVFRFFSAENEVGLRLVCIPKKPVKAKMLYNFITYAKESQAFACHFG